MDKLGQAILKKAKSNLLNISVFRDLFSYARSKEDFKLSAELKKLITKSIKAGGGKDFFELYKMVLLWEAPKLFDSYMLYIEMNRKPEQKFYQPRRKILKQVVDKLQLLADDELDELFVSMPPRVGKTTLIVFFVTWLIGRNSEPSNLYSSYTDIITNTFYRGAMEILTDSYTYLYRDVFPDGKVVQTNAAEETINVGRLKRYPSLTCRSLSGTLNGACDATGLIIGDDLLSGIEEAMNEDRLRTAWAKTNNDLLGRIQGKTKILWCGTRWSLRDPLGIRRQLLEEDERFKGTRFASINVPALDENDESNFDFGYGLGFTTEKYKERRASFEFNDDMASWYAQFMGEPIERKGAVFSPGDFRYFNGVLPSEDPDRVFMAVDPAFGGGDYVASPICAQYGDDIYVVDVVYNNGYKDITQQLLASTAIKYNVSTMQIEATKSTEAYVQGIEQLLKQQGYRMSVRTKSAPVTQAKQARIFDKAPNIKEMMIFRDGNSRSKEYELFMQNVFSFKVIGKNKHDDAPDSLSMAIDMATSIGRKVEIFKRTF